MDKNACRQFIRRQQLVNAITDKEAKKLSIMDDFNCPWTLIGGIAAAILGKPRFTADVDAVVLIDNNNIAEFITKAKKQ